MRPTTVVAMVAAFAWHALTGTAAAEPLRYDLDSADELVAATFGVTGAEHMSFGDGQLRIQTTAMGEQSFWSLDGMGAPVTRGLLVDPQPGRGYRVEARLRVSTECTPDFGIGPGFEIGDGFSHHRVHIRADSITVAEHTVELEATSELRTFRFEARRPDRVRLFVDGVQVLDDDALRLPDPSRRLAFGDL